MPQVRAMVDEFRRTKKSRVKTSEIDPARDVERAEQLKVKYGIALKGNGILVRANNRNRFIAEEEIIIKGLNRDRENPSVDFRGEDALISAIIGLIEGETRKFYFVAGKGATTQSGSELSYLVLAEQGKQQNFEVLPLNLTEVEPSPNDASGLLGHGAKYDFNPQRDEGARRLLGAEARGSCSSCSIHPGETPRCGSSFRTTG